MECFGASGDLQRRNGDNASCTVWRLKLWLTEIAVNRAVRAPQTDQRGSLYFLFVFAKIKLKLKNLKFFILWIIIVSRPALGKKNNL